MGEIGDIAWLSVILYKALGIEVDYIDMASFHHFA